MKYTDYDTTKFKVLEKVKGLEGLDERVKSIITMRAVAEEGRRKRGEDVEDSIFKTMPMKPPPTGRVLDEGENPWVFNEPPKPAPKPMRPALEEKLTKKIQELEQKLQRKNVLKRNVDKRLREATKKLKQIEEAVQQARNPVLLAPQQKEEA